MSENGFSKTRPAQSSLCGAVGCGAAADGRPLALKASGRRAPSLGAPARGAALAHGGGSAPGGSPRGRARVGSGGRLPRWQGFPAPFLGYGFLYAWGYVSWIADPLSTQAVSGGEFNLSWLVSATLVPVLLAFLALVGLRRDVEHARPLYALAPALAVAGSALSVACQHVEGEAAARALAVASGVGTGGASALFALLWSLALSRLSMEALELVVPLSFTAPLVCAMVAPSLAQLPALVVAALLALACGWALARSRAWLGGASGGAAAEGPGRDGGSASLAGWREEPLPAAARRPEAARDIARMLLFGVAAWALMDVGPAAAGGGAGLGSEAPGQLAGGMDVSGALGYALAMALALLIIRFAVRVDFQALARMTLPVLALAMTLYALGGAAVFWASALSVALNSCCEIIMLLYFVRIAQGRPERRASLLALGSAASYLGVLFGQLGAGLLERSGVAAADPALFGLAVVCAYAFAALLIPQRSYGTVARGPGEEGASGGGAARQGREGGGALGGPSEPGRFADTSGFAWREGPRAQRGAAVAGGLDASAAAGPLAGNAEAAVPATPADPLEAACARVSEEFQLSAREAQVLSLLARGRSQAYIRDALILSKNTVATHARRLYAKLGVHSKQELIDLVEERM